VRSLHAVALGGVVAIAAALAIALHRRGMLQGDDFALYVRQAKSLLHGDMRDVVDDNRFAVVNSDEGFSPIAYPWGFPILLSPFIALLDTGDDRLKLVEVGCFVVWLTLLHGIVRRRADRVVAFAVIAVLGTTFELLEHTDQLLSEFPYLALATATIWWYDRIIARTTLLDAPWRDLALLGVLASCAFNTRREGMVLIATVGLMQLGAIVAAARGAQLGDGPRRAWKPALQRALVPHAAFLLVTAAFAVVLPSPLGSDGGNALAHVPTRWREYPLILTNQIGLGRHPNLSLVILVLALAGVIVGLVRDATRNTPLLLVAVLSATIVGSHFRRVDRYWFQVTPWVLYFALLAVAAAARVALARIEPPRRGNATALAVLLPVIAVLAVHANTLPAKVGAARDFDRAGRAQVGPSDPDIAPIYAAVKEHTGPDDVIAYFRARTMTLLTGRRAIQTGSIHRICRVADYFAQRRGSSYWQPALTAAEADERGLEMVWNDAVWILWRVPNDCMEPPAPAG
jgi:hypothetical protein